MTVTIKRKSLKKSFKKNVLSRKRNGKTRNNSGNMRGGNHVHLKSKKLPHTTRKNIKSALLEVHGKKTPAEIKKFKKTKEWQNLKQETVKHIIEQQEKNKKVFNVNGIKNLIFARKKILNNEKAKINLQVPVPVPVLNPVPVFNTNKLVLPNGVKIYDLDETRNYINSEVYAKILSLDLPPGTTIKSLWNPVYKKILFYKYTETETGRAMNLEPLIDIDKEHISVNIPQTVLQNPNYSTSNLLQNPNYGPGIPPNSPL